MKRVKILMTSAFAVLTVALMAISASASTPTTTLDMNELLTTTGASLSAQFVVMVGALMPVVVGIAVTGLGIYAVVTLFKLAKSLFAKVSL